MKKILTLMIVLLSGLFNNSIKANTKDSIVTSSIVYNDLKSLYKEDLKDVIKYSVTKADTLLTKGYKIISKGAAHTYEILKTQQLVKSYYHLFYFIVGIVGLILFIYRLKLYKEDDSELNATLLFIFGFIDIGLSIYNAINFNEMLTGFINPEYGAILEILEQINK